MEACPLCSGTTGYRHKVLVEYDVQHDWNKPWLSEAHHEDCGVYKNFKRRYCMDCNKCVSAILDAPTFKL
jgi:hypothetical protein